MKTKYLFGMLVSGAMLAACSADDALTPSHVAQNATQPAPVFTVHFDQNRAAWLEQSNGGYKIGFEDGDLLSLYNGGTAPTSSSAAVLTSDNNAVYEGKENDNTGEFTLTTRSMVKPGAAIMIYPADTAFHNTGSTAPAIEIPAIQDEKTKLFTPYMSEILTIKNYPTDGSEDINSEDQAGYGRKYDIYLRRVGSTLELTTTLDKAPAIPSSVTPLEVTGVVLKTGENGKFTTKVPVKALNNVPGAVDTEKDLHLSWSNKSDLDLESSTSIGKADSLYTYDVDGGKAIFTLLPSLGTTEYAGHNDDEITIYTNYGQARLKTVSNSKIWTNSKESILLKEGFAELLNNKKSLWDPASSGTFKGENVGYYLKKSVKVDMSKFTMDRLHIVNGKHLREALVVYQTLYSDKEVNFILDGNEDGEFVMDKATWSALETQLNKTNNKLHVITCSDVTEKNVCETVVLQSGDSEEEVPALVFTDKIGTDANEVTSALKDVVLEGTWKYTSVEQGTPDKRKNLKGFENLVVAEGSTLTPKSVITATGDFSIVIEKGATLMVKDGVSADLIGLKLYNHGTIEIKENSFLRAGKDAEIENCALDQDDDNSITGLSKGAGQVNNYGTLARIKTTTGVVNNYGVISIMNDEAATMITANAVDKALINKPFGASLSNGTNKLGSIILKKADGNKLTEIKESARQGLIKLKVTESNPSAEAIGMANYVILTGNCKAVTTNDVDEDVPGFPASTVKYIESEVTNVQLTGSYTGLNALIVTQGTVQILKGTTVNVKNYGQLYVKGKITLAGTLTYDDKAIATDGTAKVFEGYFGGNNSTDYKNISE